MTALAPSERSKLVKVLAMLGSNHDGERAAAGLLAMRILATADITWGELLGVDAAPRRSSAPEPCRRAETDLAACRRHPGLLSAWERSFVAGIIRRRKPMTAKQETKLATIATELQRRCKA